MQTHITSDTPSSRFFKPTVSIIITNQRIKTGNTPAMPSQQDKNFDSITTHFEKKIYGKRKGKIRLAVLWRDIEPLLKKHTATADKTQLKVLDVGGGFGQIAQRIAKLGHQVTVNDISENMLNKARTLATDSGIDHIEFIHAPYQALPDLLNKQTYDIILCHAVLEWLAEPQHAISILKPLLAPEGTLSLCFYNPVAKIYRNLIMGNFYNLDQVANQTFKSDEKSLTPNNPCSIEDVKQWLAQANMHILQETGIRVFSDYIPAVLAKRGGHANLDAVIEKELAFSQKAPYKYMGRYYHILAS